MSYVDAVEYVGPLLASGLMTREDAIRFVHRASDGDLTEAGAADVLTRWGSTIRAELADIFMDAELRLAAVRAAAGFPPGARPA